MRALFIGHGSPMTVISDLPERRALQELGRRLPRSKAILAISAHWGTRGTSPWARPSPRCAGKAC